MDKKRQSQLMQEYTEKVVKGHYCPEHGKFYKNLEDLWTHLKSEHL